MNRIALVSAIALLSACSGGGIQMPDFRGGGSDTTEAMAPEAPVMTAEERLVAAAEGQGCLIDPTTINTVLANANLSVDDLRTVVPALEAQGRIVGAGDTSLRVVSDACPATT